MDSTPFKLHQTVYINDKHGIVEANSAGKVMAIYPGSIEVDVLYKDRHISLFLDNWNVRSAAATFPKED